MSGILFHHTPLYLLRQDTLLNPEFSHCPGYPLFLPKCWDYRELPHLSNFHVGSGGLNFSSYTCEASDSSTKPSLQSQELTVAALNYYNDWNVKP